MLAALFGSVTFDFKIATLHPGEIVTLNNFEIEYGRDGSLYPGGCFTQSIDVDPTKMEVRVNCGGLNYNVWVMREEDVAYVYRETRFSHASRR